MQEHTLSQLEEAIKHLAEARRSYEEALAALEEARVRAIRQGLEGKNETARKAELREKTADEERRVHEAKVELVVAEAALETARARDRWARLVYMAEHGLERVA